MISDSNGAVAETDFQSVLANVGLWRLDLRTDAMRGSSSFENLLGFPPSDAFARKKSDWLARVHPDDQKYVAAAFLHAVEGDEGIQTTFRVSRSDSSIRWIFAKGEVVRDHRGGLSHIKGIAIEVNNDFSTRDKQYRFLAESLPQMVWTLNSTAQLDQYQNQFTLDYFGVALEHTRELSWQDVIHPDDYPMVESIWGAAVANGIPYEYEFRLRRYDGAYRWFLCRAWPMKDDLGVIVRWFGTCIDIDDRKRAHAQLDAVFEGAAIGIALLDRDLRFVRINDAVTRSLGVRREGHVGRPLHEVMPEFAVALEPVYRSVLEGGEPIVNQEIRGTTRTAPHRQLIWLINVYPVRVCGETTGLAVMMNEITERMQAQQTLRESEERSRVLLALLDTWVMNAPVGLGFVDERLRFVRINDALAMAVAGRPAHEHVGRMMREMAPSLALMVEPILEEVLRTGEPAVQREMFAPDGRGGSPIDWLADYYPVCANGRTIGVGITATNITSQKEAERSRAVLLEHERAARAKAEEASHAKDDFLATLSHELRTPLNAMLGWARLLRNGQLPDEQHARALAAIERNAVAQAQLIEDLLDVSRIVSGKLRLELQSIDLRTILEAAIDAVRPALETKGIHLTSALGTNPEPVTVDPHRLQQIVWNLLSNSIKFTNEGGHVAVELRRSKSHFEIRIEDTGKGIAPEFQPYLFDRFSQSDASTTRGHRGLGIGLAITRHLTELHGGTIEAFSEGEGRGACFTIRFPISISKETEFAAPRHRIIEAKSEVVESPPELNGLRILVIDDEVDAREMMSTVLQCSGARVASTASATEALAWVAAGQIDVLLSDIGMPGEDGYSLIGRVRALPNGIRLPAAAVTAYAGPEDHRRALLAGYQMHVVKPIEPSKLVAVVVSLAQMSLSVASPRGL